MTSIILNKIQIIPSTRNADEYEKQIETVCKFCRGIEDGIYKNICFSKIKPIPKELKEDSREEDNWVLANWGARSKALNCRWENDDEILFETITYPAIPIFEAIAAKFPHIKFNYAFSNKKIGMTTGKMAAKDGSVFFNERYEDLSEMAFMTFFHLNHGMRRFFTYDPEKQTFHRNLHKIKEAIEENGFYKDDNGTVIIGHDDRQKPLFDTVDDLPF